LKVYDEVIENLNDSVARAKIGQSDKAKALEKLHQLSKTVEKDFIPEPEQFDKLIEKEWKDSPKYGGMTVFGKASQIDRPKVGQLGLF